jgi:hypothetical protein
MTSVDQYEQFAKAYGDPTLPTYNNATETYHFLNPHVTRDSAKKAGSRMLKDERVRAHLVAYRRRSQTLAAKSPEDYLIFGWEAMQKLEALMMTDAKYATGLAKMYETVGKAGGYIINRTEDMTPLERKAPISPAEARTLLEARMEASTSRFDRINQPLPLPGATTTLIPAVPAVADEEIPHTILPRDDEPNEAADDAVHAG